MDILNRENFAGCTKTVYTTKFWIFHKMFNEQVLEYKLDWVARLITDPDPDPIKKNIKKNMGHVTPEMGHLKHDMS